MLTLTSWGQDKAQVETYLQSLRTSEDAMMVALDELPLDHMLDNLETYLVQAQNVAEKLEVVKSTVETYPVPEPAQQLHDLTIAGYQLTIDMVHKTGSLATVMKDALAFHEGLGDNSNPDEATMDQLADYKAQVSSKQKELEALGRRIEEVEGLANTERAKLREEFGIPEPTVDRAES